MRWIANVALACAIWCASIIVLIIAGGPRPSLALALIPPAVLVAPSVFMAVIFQIWFRHRPDLEYEEFRRARWLVALPLGLRIALFAGLAGFWITTLTTMVGHGNEDLIPRVRNGQYLLVERGGQTTAITKAEYDLQMRRAEQIILALIGFFADGSAISILGMESVDAEHQRRAASYQARVAQHVVPSPAPSSDNDAATRRRIAEREGRLGEV